MFVITVGLLLTLVIALGVVALFALPQLRTGSRILTPDAERVVGRAKEQARQRPAAAAGTTWAGLVALNAGISRAWAPVSQTLHDLMDRLENRPPAEAPVVESPIVESPLVESPLVGRPRPTPAVSGPIPTFSQTPAADVSYLTDSDFSDPDFAPDLLIDLRGLGSARHAR